MKWVEEFLAHLDVFAEAPEGIERLRGMLLDLAIRGRLVPRAASDEPAARLLERIAQERKRLRWPAPRAYDTEEAPPPFELPSTWSWTCLAQLGVVAPRNEAADEAEVAFVPMPAIPTDYRQPVAPTPRPWGEIKKGYTHFANGDVALAKITPCFQNRKSCVMEGLPGGMGAGTTELHVLRPVPGLVNTRYLLLFLKSPHFIEGGIPRMTGTAGQQRVPVDYFASTPFPLPPLCEQQRIVDRLDQLMSLCDELEAKQNRKQEVETELTRSALEALTSTGGSEEFDEVWGRLSDHFEVLFDTPERVEELRQTVLELAVRGRLEKQVSTDPPAAQLLEALLGSQGPRKKSAKAAEKTQGGSSPEALRFPVPESWRWCSIADVVEPGQSISYGVLVPGPDVEDGIPFVRVQDLAVRGQVSLPARRISREVEEPYTRTRLNGGELLLGVVGSIGKVGIAPMSWKGANIARAVCRLAPHPMMDAGFLALLLQSRFMQSYFKDTTRTLAQPTLNVAMIRSAPVPLPPVPEQKRIAARVARLMALCDALELKLRETDRGRERLAEAMTADMMA